MRGVNSTALLIGCTDQRRGVVGRCKGPARAVASGDADAVDRAITFDGIVEGGEEKRELTGGLFGQHVSARTYYQMGKSPLHNAANCRQVTDS